MAAASSGAVERVPRCLQPDRHQATVVAAAVAGAVRAARGRAVALRAAAAASVRRRGRSDRGDRGGRGRSRAALLRERMSQVVIVLGVSAAWRRSLRAWRSSPRRTRRPRPVARRAALASRDGGAADL